MSKHTMSKEPPRLFDSVKLTRKEYQALIAQIDRLTAPTKRHTTHNNRRGQTRYIYNPDAKLICQLAREEGPAVQIVVRCRNISVGGLGFLHGSYVHPGTGCVLTLISAFKQGYRIHGTIVRCRHLTKNIHEVGVQFEAPIDLEKMVRGLVVENEQPPLRKVV